MRLIDADEFKKQILKGKHIVLVRKMVILEQHDRVMRD